MRKSADEIEKDIFLMVKNCKVAKEIKGAVYRDGMRAIDSISEDIVVSFKTGLDGQFQTGELSVNTYVPNITKNGWSIKNVARCNELANLIMGDLNGLTNGEYLISLKNIPQSYKVENINQYFINARLRFRRI